MDRSRCPKRCHTQPVRQLPAPTDHTADLTSLVRPTKTFSWTSSSTFQTRLPQKCRGILDWTMCTRNTKQLTGLSFTRFDTVTDTKSQLFRLIQDSVTSR